MPLDAICMCAINRELNSSILGARVDKIFQPDRDVVIINLRGAEGSMKLIISAASGSARICLTTAAKDNPASPPMFCMLLRKHLSGARISEVTQPGLERIIEIKFDCRDDMGFPVTKRIIVELMGKWSNIVLVDENERIIDCIHKSSGAVSAMRSLLPGLYYNYPDRQEKHDLLALANEDILELAKNRTTDILAEKWLMDTFVGISPLISRECAYAAGTTGMYLYESDLEKQVAMAQFAMELKDKITKGNFTPVMLSGDEPKDFSFMELHQYDGTYACEIFDSFSQLLEKFYAERDRSNTVRQRGHDIIKALSNARDRILRKVQNQRKELVQSIDRDHLRRCGDIITANLHNMERGMNVLETEDFYDPSGAVIRIKLDPLKTPQQNAAKYYKDYSKAKNAEKILTEQIAIGERELDYIGSVMEAMDRADGEQAISEIRSELEQNGYLKRQKNGKKQMKGQKISAPLQFRSSSGLRIMVGKNNTQNDVLTLKTAYKSDYWFHTQKIHGSHVILFTDGLKPDDASVEEAAILAAWFSQAKGSQNIPVDYTAVKNVKKPNGARPGMVVYETYSTAYVTPNAEIVEKLKM